MVPLAPLAEFAAHEQQFLARVRPHEAQVGPQVGEFLPAVAGHLVDQRVLAVHHFIVGNRQNEPLRPGVHQAEAQFVVMMGAVHRVLLNVVQRIVHPAHVPFIGKAQAALLRALADPRPGRGLFGNHQRPRCFQRDDVVEVTQEVDGLEVLPAAMAIRHPLAGLARVVAVQHRRHRIDPQAIDVEMLEPVQRRRQHVAVHFGAAQVVDQGVPVLVKAFLRITVFVQRSAVELGQAMGVGGEMRRHPVEDHADARQVAGIDEGGEFVAGAVAGAGGELRKQLIAPGTAERVFHDRHQLDVGKAQFFHVRNQALAQLRPGVLAGDFAQVIQLALPGTGVQFVDRQRRRRSLTLAAGRHPVLILPVDLQRRGDFRGGVRWQAGGQCHGIGLEGQDPVLAEDFVFVGLPCLQAWNEQLPDTGGVAQAHRMTTTVPAVEVPHHRHPPGVRCPHGEAHAIDAIHGLQLGAQGAAQIAVVAFGEQIQIHLAQQRAKTVGVFGNLLATGPAGSQQIRLCPLEMTGEQPGGLCRFKVAQFFSGLLVHHLHAQGARQIGPDELSAGAIAVGTENGKGIAMLGAHQRIDIPRFG
ncbi:hypothetical protein D3C76_832010 [compost metagenome]